MKIFVMNELLSRGIRKIKNYKGKSLFNFINVCCCIFRWDGGCGYGYVY